MSRIEKNDIDLICTWIEEQTTKVKWPAIQEAAPGVTGKTFSIPTLRHPLIIAKRDEKNDRIALGQIDDESELPPGREQTRHLRIRAQVLQAENQNLLVQNTNMILNAHRMGYSMEELERELPPSKRPTREDHEKRMKATEEKTRSRIEKQKENERNMEKARAARKAKARKALHKVGEVNA